MRCLIVDDEPLALDVLENYIGKVPELELVGRCTSAMEALDFLSKNEVDLLFLDIQMSDLTGIQLLKSLTDPPMVVFTTAYQNYALEGYELDVLDYLMKPVPFDRFVKAVNKARDIYQLRKTNEEVQVSVENDKSYIFVKSEHQMIKVDFDDILYIEGLKDYVKIVCKSGRPILSLQNVKAIESKLPPKHFQRVHKSYIVSLANIAFIRRGRITIQDKEIPIGDSYKDAFMKLIE